MGVRSAAKVAVQFCRGGNIRRVLRRLRKTPTLGSCVEESPVLDDRTAYGCPELVLPQYGGDGFRKPAGDGSSVGMGYQNCGREGRITTQSRTPSPTSSVVRLVGHTPYHSPH